MKKAQSSKLKAQKLIVIILTFLVLGYFFGVAPAWRAYASFKEVSSHVRPLKDGFILQNLSQIKRELGEIKKGIGVAKSNVRPLVWLRAIPIVGGYYADLTHTLSAGEHIIEALSLMIEDLEPVAEEIGFTTDKKAAPPLSGQDRIAGLIKIAPAISTHLEAVGMEISAARREVGKVEPSRYPKRLGGREIRPLISQAQLLLDGLDTNFSDVGDFISILPDILGGKTLKTYLVLFQNDKELRPTGGFWTAYALVRIEQGRIVNIAAGDMYFLDIDNKVPFYPPAPPVVKKYLKLDDWYIRDVNLSPDYRKSVETLGEFWARIPGVPRVDAVFAIDTVLVEELLGIIGGISLPGYEEFTKENIVYQLELYANVLGSRLEKRGGRKDLLGVLMREMVGKTFALPATEYDTLLAKFFDLAQRKHLLLFFYSKTAQTLAEKYNFAGRLRESKGDYLHVNDANFAGRKANWYVEEKVVKEVRVARGGRVESTVTIDYENTGDYHPEWNTGYRDYVRVYAPRGSKLISSDGSLEPIETGEDLGKTYFAAYLAVDPKRKARLTLTYELPEGVVSGKTYKLLVQKQPGTEGQEYTVKVGKKKETFKLERDKEFRFKL